MQFQLITPERVVMTEEIYEAILPAVEGQIAVLPNHIPLVTLLKPGVISLRVKKDDPDTRLEHIATSGGFVEITGSSIKLMADTAERSDELDDLKIKEAKAAAQKAISEAKDEVSYADAIGHLQVELAREKVRNLRRHSGRHHDIQLPTE